jgi:two-component system, OmpR family, response regulator
MEPRLDELLSDDMVMLVMASDGLSAFDWRRTAAGVESRRFEGPATDCTPEREPAASRMKILIVEDDAETADYLAGGLRELGHTVDVARNGRDGLFLAAGEPYDVAVVDRMLPQLDGLAMVKTLRGAGVKVPVLFLTAVGGIDDRVQGLEAGADDYLIKPFAFAELVARINALGRRPRRTLPESSLRVADLEIDLLARSVCRAGAFIDLQPREYRLLEYLMRHAGQVVTRTMLLENVWDMHFDPHTNVVESHISRLRGKLDKDGRTELIHTIRGAGYCLRAPA